MSPNDIVVTIEYCSNCKFHSGTTRHDEEKYLNLALELEKSIKYHFPII